MNRVFAELLAQLASSFSAERKQHDARRRFVQAMDGVDFLVKLSSEYLQRVTGFVAVDGASMNQQTGRLVNGNHVFILEENRQCFIGLYDVRADFGAV